MFGTTACAVDVEEEEDELVEDDDVGTSEQELRNIDVVSTKLCARVKRETMLRRYPAGAATVKTLSGKGAKLEVEGGWKYVLVQREPGTVRGRVWTDPDLAGLTDVTNRTKMKSLARRCGMKKNGKLNLTSAKRAVAVAKADPYNRRGWVDEDDLAGLPKDLPSVRSTGAPLQKRDKEAIAKLEGTLKRVKGGCITDSAYVGGNPDNPTSMRSYGTCFEIGSENGQPVCRNPTAEMYVLYNTPEIDNGGMTFAYLAVGVPVHVLRVREHEQTGDHCQATSSVPGAQCNGAMPEDQRVPRFRWAEIWASSGGRTITGYVPEQCLE